MGILIPEAASICKKCIAPKPPRTHHCSICNRCILKMDHHCPWLNNCIGHYNHRYFFMYMVYTCLGVLFLMIFGCEIAYNEVWLEPEEEIVGHPVRFNNSVMIAVTELMFDDASEKPESYVYNAFRHRSLIYMAFICSGVFVALGSLSMWHAQLIGRGETSIEAHINVAETKRLAAIKRKYLNPYNFGSRKNWRLFLGVVKGRTWWHVIFPSAHKPIGAGILWQTIRTEQEEELHSVTGGSSSYKPFPPVFEMMKVKPKRITNDSSET